MEMKEEHTGTKSWFQDVLKSVRISLSHSPFLHRESISVLHWRLTGSPSLWIYTEPSSTVFKLLQCVILTASQRCRFKGEVTNAKIWAVKISTHRSHSCAPLHPSHSSQYCSCLTQISPDSTKIAHHSLYTVFLVQHYRHVLQKLDLYTCRTPLFPF